MQEGDGHKLGATESQARAEETERDARDGPGRRPGKYQVKNAQNKSQVLYDSYLCREVMCVYHTNARVWHPAYPHCVCAEPPGSTCRSRDLSPWRH